MNALYKLAIGAAVAVLLAIGLKCQYDRSIRKQDQHAARLDSLNSVVRHTDSVYVADTFRLHRQIILADTLRRNLVLTDTVRVRRVLTEDSIALRACVETTSSCATTIRARDSLIAELRRPLPSPRLSLTGDVLYEPLNRSLIARAGPEYRLWWGFSLKAEAELRSSAAGAYGGTLLRVGISKRF